LLDKGHWRMAHGRLGGCQLWVSDRALDAPRALTGEELVDPLKLIGTLRLLLM